MNSVFRLTLIICLIIILPFHCYRQRSVDNSDLQQWPAGYSPLEIGNRVAWHFLDSPHFIFSQPGLPKTIAYPETCAWYGALEFARSSADSMLLGRLIARFEPLFGKDSLLLPSPDNVYYSVFGAVPLDIYRLSTDQRFFTLGKWFADKQWETPTGENISPETKKLHDQGFTPQSLLWVDDTYMITILQCEAYLATGDKNYIERAAKEMVMYLDSLQRPNGLFYHAPDVPFFWGRGNGWIAAGMSELLRSLPENNSDKPKILACYKKMMAALVNFQDKNGTWKQLIDEPSSWTETSSSGMFAYAMITGVKNGWLDKSIYSAAARKAWLGLVRYIDENADIHEVCESTLRKNDKQYYLSRKRNIGDLHGQAPVLWCATALLR
jgi:unsaturated rhamnogalacturonyl hydrolase